jgi:hypothetical protein
MTLPSLPYSSFEFFIFQVENLFYNVIRQQQEFGIHWISSSSLEQATSSFLHPLNSFRHDPVYNTPHEILPDLFPFSPNLSYLDSIFVLHADFHITPRILF